MKTISCNCANSKENLKNGLFAFAQKSLETLDHVRSSVSLLISLYS